MTLAYPDYYSQTVAGNMFVGASETPKTGKAIPIADTTAPIFALWNPAGSGKNAVLVRFSVVFVSTTGAPGGILYNALTGAGSAIGTAAPLSAFHSTTPTNCLVGSGYTSAMKFSGAATNTLTTAGTTIDNMGISQLTTTGATTSAPLWKAVDDFNGRLIIPPGVVFYPTGTDALLSLFDISLSWFEVPI